MEIKIDPIEYNKVVLDHFKNECLTRFNKVTVGDMYTVTSFHVTEANKIFLPWSEDIEAKYPLMSKGQVLDAKKNNKWSEPDELTRLPWFGWWYTGFVCVRHYVNKDFMWSLVAEKNIFVEFIKNGEGSVVVAQGLDWKPERVVCGHNLLAKMSSAKTYKRARLAGWI